MLILIIDCKGKSVTHGNHYQSNWKTNQFYDCKILVDLDLQCTHHRFGVKISFSFNTRRCCWPIDRWILVLGMHTPVAWWEAAMHRSSCTVLSKYSPHTGGQWVREWVSVYILWAGVVKVSNWVPARDGHTTTWKCFKEFSGLNFAPGTKLAYIAAHV